MKSPRRHLSWLALAALALDLSPWRAAGAEGVATDGATDESLVRMELGGSSASRGTRFSNGDEAHFSERLVSMLRKPCEAYARNILDEPALHLQHAAVIFLRHKCRGAAPAVPGQTSHPCADLANTVSIDLTHAEASELLRQLLHERCQAEAIILSTAESQSLDAAAFLVKDTVRRVAEEEQELRDYAGVPMDRDEIAKRPRVPEEGPLLLEDRKNDSTFEDVDSGSCKSDGAGPTGCSGKERDGDELLMGGGRSARAREFVPARWGWDGPDAEDVSSSWTGDEADVDEVSRVERMVLVDLYRVAEGSRWARQRGWLSRAPHCSWEGVSCLKPHDPAGVLSLALPRNGLTGTLPQTLARLHHLRHLDLSENALRGTLSSAMGSMRRLRVLQLRSNTISGKIPGELGAASSLEQLDLSDNHLTGRLSDDLGRMQALRMLNVSSNGLSGQLPLAVCALPALEVLSVARNRLSGDLWGVAATLGAGGNSSSIRLFDASDNAFTGPPPRVPGEAPALTIWDVSRNALAGTLPQEPPPLSLRIIAMAGNSGISGPIPSAMFPVTSGLRHVDLSSNALNGTLPESLAGLMHARLINVSNNAIEGTIPSEGFVDLRRLQSLQTLDASNNRLTGTIPPALAGLTTLRLFDLSNNALNGTLPAQQMAGLVRLRKLNLKGNALSGSLPPELASLRRLTHLDLSDNQFTGAVPVALMTGAALEHLDISGNDLDWTSLGASS